MGRGDKRTRKGKITIGSYGKSRPRKAVVSAAAVKAAPVAKVAGAVSKTAPKAAGAKADKKKKA